MRGASAADFLKANPAAVRVTVHSVKGSAPREEGAFMLVSQQAIRGTIGGGQLEYMAIDAARQMMAQGATGHDMDVGLGPEIGQCCGGRVKLKLEAVDDTVSASIIAEEKRALERLPHVYLFGAGHVGNALARAFSLLPVRTILVDPRESELEAAPEGVEPRHLAMPESSVRDAPEGGAFLILTHDHALDFLILKEVLARPGAAYVGMIGSKSKRATFTHWFKREGGAEAALERLVCPMGGSAVKDKRPEVIAALTVAEVMTAILNHPSRMAEIASGS